MAGGLAALLAPFVLCHAADPAPASAQEKEKMMRATEQELFDQPSRIPARLARGELTVKDIPNPHWRADACRACHAEPATKRSSALRDKDPIRLCNTCHETVSPHRYIHTVGQQPDNAMRARMPKDMQATIGRGGGVVSCITCHDLPATCVAKRAGERRLNPLFLRGGAPRVRTELCFRCHDRGQYARLNPHEQLAADGRVKEESCPVCHRGVPDREARDSARAGYNVETDLARLCDGCHKTVPHPGGVSFKVGSQLPNHLVKPSGRVTARMKAVQETRRLNLPLDATNGQVTCTTCHQAHQTGVLAGGAGLGADNKHRLRANDLCTVCHEL